jgi:hypothetical protein
MNSTPVSKVLFQSNLGKGTNLDTEKNRTGKRELDEKKKSDLFCGDCCGYHFDSHTNDDWIQSMECKVCFYERCYNERVVNTGLCALCDEGCAALTSDSDELWNHLNFSLLLSKHILITDFF